MRLLLVEDDMELYTAVSLHLKRAGYEVDICTTGDDAEYYFSNAEYDVIILDRMLPGLDGITVLERIRKMGIVTPVIMVTAMGSKKDKVDGLDCGADDYLVKPYDIDELLARVRALLRRPRIIEKHQVLQYGDLEFDVDSLIMSCRGEQVSLTKKEGALMKYLILNKEQIILREQILSRLWGMDNFVEDGNIDNYIYFIRRRLKALNTNVSIKTIHGIGYRMENN